MRVLNKIVLVQDSDNLREALRHSASMLAELRTSFLTPQKYFELYMQVFDKLTYLEVSLLSSIMKTKSLCQCYR